MKDERRQNSPPSAEGHGRGDASPLDPREVVAERRRELQLEILFDLTVALHSHQTEQRLVDDLLQRLCAVVDPAAAVAITRDGYGAARAAATVGWTEAPPAAESLLSSSIWREVLGHGTSIAMNDGELAGRGFREGLAAPIVYRGTYLGFLAIFDKEHRRGGEPRFSREDRRFLDAVAALSGVAVDGLRQVESLVHRSEGLAEENKVLRAELASAVDGQRIVAHAEAMRRALQVVERVAPRSVNLLVRGESGTGKELVAKLVHALSGRTGPMVAVNCAAMPEGLLESELFGIEGGVATGVDARVGKFELADSGTLFLDEIGDMQPALQVKLLRVLQEREVVRVGGHQPIPVDVRLVTATHRDLTEMIANHQFREDLFYRIKGVEVELPPLRERRQDIPHLVRYFLERFCAREEIEVPVIEPAALALLLAHDFPGNVRELQNLVEGAVSLADSAVGPELIRSMIGGHEGPGPEALELDAVERRHIQKVLRMTAGNKSAAAKILGLNRRTLARKGF